MNECSVTANISGVYPQGSPATRADSISAQPRRNSSSHYSGIRTRSVQPPPPPDSDAFTFLPCFLGEWQMSEAIWNALPEVFHSHLAALQRAGAATMTSIHRLKALQAELKGKVLEEERDDDEDEYEDEDGAVVQPDFLARPPSLTSLLSFHSDDHTLPDRCTTPRTPILSAEFCIGSGPSKPDGFGFGSMRRQDSPSSRSMSQNYTAPATNPRVSQWRAELNTLQTDGIVRLRHAIRRVEGEWPAIAVMLESIHGLDIETYEAWQYLTTTMDIWIADKRHMVTQLEAQTRALGVPICLGWGCYRHVDTAIEDQ